MNYYSHHIGDFNNATRHLTLLERGVYRDLLDLYYDAEGPLTGGVDALARKVCARLDAERAALDAVLGEFFALTADGYRNSRADREVEKYKTKLEIAAAGGRASVEARLKRKSTPVEPRLKRKSTPVEPRLNLGCDSVEPTKNQEPITKNQEPETKSEGADALGFPEALHSDRFKAAWDQWLKFRISLRAPVKEQTRAASLKQLAEWGVDDAVLAIETSIRNGWRGLFPPKQSTTSKQTSKPKSEYATDW